MSLSFIKKQFIDCLNKLGLSRMEAAKLFSVDPKTLNRWIKNPHKIPGAVEETLHAWLRLKHYNLPWKPDGIDLINLNDGNIEWNNKVSVLIDENKKRKLLEGREDNA